ncbi:MAG: hypothetical protein AB1705_28005 [Verrucomicrobiota bacterium]
MAYVAIDSLQGKLERKEPAWYTLLDCIADVIVLGLFVGYWLPPFDGASGLVAVALFVFSLFWFLGCIPYQLRAFEERDFSPEMNRLYKRFVLALGIVLSFPAYWFGGMAAFRSL